MKNQIKEKKINYLKEELRVNKEKKNNLEINLSKLENNYDLLKNDYMKLLNQLNEKDIEFEREKNKYIEEYVEKYKKKIMNYLK